MNSKSKKKITTSSESCSRSTARISQLLGQPLHPLCHYNSISNQGGDNNSSYKKQSIYLSLSFILESSFKDDKQEELKIILLLPKSSAADETMRLKRVAACKNRITAHYSSKTWIEDNLLIKINPDNRRSMTVNMSLNPFSKNYITQQTFYFSVFRLEYTTAVQFTRKSIIRTLNILFMYVCTGQHFETVGIDFNDH